MSRFYETIRQYYDDIFPLNPAQVSFVQRRFPDKASSLLEVGCANGKLTAALAEYDIMGIDLEPSFITMARARYPMIPFQAMNMLDIDQLKIDFDGIVCFGNTLVHLSHEEIQQFLTHAVKRMKPDGRLLLQILNYDHILDANITQLPLIDNDIIRFDRRYVIGERLQFQTELTIKATGQQLNNVIPLTPIRLQSLETMLKTAGFNQWITYSGFDDRLYQREALPLVIECKRS